MTQQSFWLGAAIGAAILLSGSNFSQAQELPEYDREIYCDRVTQANADDPSVKTLCLDAEQAAYQAMSAAWSDLPTEVRTTCRDMGVEAGGSYFVLANCVTPHIMATMPK